MPKGLQSIEGAQQDIEARKAAGGAAGALFFRVEPGATETVRFLEQGDELAWAWVHELKAEPGKQFGQKVACRDQGEDGERIGAACPGCDDGLARTFQGYINVIWRNAPLYDRDENNRMRRDKDNNFIVVGEEDQVALWKTGITVFGQLTKKDGKYKGLRSRDFEVQRRGSGLQTEYYVEPADPDAGPQEMSEKDKALLEEKTDLTPLITPPPFDQWGQRRKQNASQPETRPSDTSPFTRRRD